MLDSDVKDTEPAGISDRLARILDSKLVVAVVTVALTGVFSTVIASRLQDSAKERELKNTWLHDRAAHRTAAQKTFLDEQRTAAEQAFKCVGRLRMAAQNLLRTTGNAFADSNFKPGRRQLVNEQQREQLRGEFNGADDEWEKTSEQFRYMLADYPVTENKVPPAWDQLHVAVEDLRRCAESQYLLWTSDGTPRSEACRDQDSLVMAQWQKLSTALRLSRERARWDWENASALGDVIETAPISH
jgi:hypothetical protein